MELDVTVQLAGEDVRVGRLFTHARRGVESASFSYDDNYLRCVDAFALSPDLPLSEGAIHTSGQPLFAAFEDCMPDRWGRNLMLRAERLSAREDKRAPRMLLEGDFLAGVSDVTRQGAIRVWEAGTAVAVPESGVPREVDLPRLIAQADLATRDMDADVRDLMRAGSSLGGARPKASVIDEGGVLCIAKFPKAEETVLDDTCAWEHVALVLAGMCGIVVPKTRLLRLGGRAVLLLQRFDRKGDARVPYLSGMSAVQGTDGGAFSYLELVDFLEETGARPTSDIRQLWLRILYSCAIGNVDDHMRNHGFLRDGAGWTLSPAFDLNPTEGCHTKYLSCAIDFDEREASPTAALEACAYFRLTQDQARQSAHNMALQLRHWRRVATADGVSKASIERMASCFESGIERLEAL